MLPQKYLDADISEWKWDKMSVNNIMWELTCGHVLPQTTSLQLPRKQVYNNTALYLVVFTTLEITSNRCSPVCFEGVRAQHHAQ